MKDNKVKSFYFMGGLPTDIYNGIFDIFVTLYNKIDGKNFCSQILTLCDQNMDETKKEEANLKYKTENSFNFLIN